MDLYTFSLAIGGVGLGVMALGGVGHRGHGGQHAAHGHGSHAHGAHAHGAHAHGPHAHPPHAHGAAQGALAPLLWTLATPRIVFAVLLGFGAAGIVLRAFVGGVVLFAMAVVVGVAFERFAMRPLFEKLLGFASSPAATLDSAIMDEARAASGFDANGEGLVALELDGQVVQVLGTLRHEDRALGLRVRAGDRLRVEEVDGARHRCTVSFIARP